VHQSGPQLRTAILRSVTYCRAGCDSSLFQNICVLTENSCASLHNCQLLLSHQHRKPFHLCIRHQRVNFFVALLCDSVLCWNIPPLSWIIYSFWFPCIEHSCPIHLHPNPQQLPLPNSVMPKNLKHTKPGENFIGNSRFIFRNWKIAKLFPFPFLQAFGWGRTKVPREIFCLPINPIGHYVRILAITTVCIV